MRRAVALALLAAACARETPPPVVPGAHADPSALAASADGRLVYVACPAQQAVAVVDARRGELHALRGIGARPGGLALAPGGGELAVSLPDEDGVLLLDAGSLAPLRRFAAGFEPMGLAFGGDGRLLFVANARGGDVSVLDAASGNEVRRVAAGREPYAVARSPDGAAIAVVSRMADVGGARDEPRTELTLLDAATGDVRRRVALVSCHLAESLAFTRDGARVLVPLVRVRNLLPIVQVDRGWVMSTVLATVDAATGAVAYLPLGDAEEGFPDPTGIAVSAGGERAFVSARGTDRVAEVRIADALALEREAGAGSPERLSWTPRYVASRFDVGPGPAALAAAGTALAVAERLGDAVALFGADGRLAARVRIVPPVADDAVRRGDRVFHDARYAFQRSFSCSSCHPGGHTDGLTYDFEIDGIGRNFVLNRSLRGVKGTAPFKWNGRNATLAEQCGPRFAKVLTRADVFPPQDLEDVVAYVESLPAPRADPRTARVDGRETGAAARGRAIFERARRRDGSEIPAADRCTTCHPPPHYSNLRREGVGTQSGSDDTGTFDVPHLTAIGSKAPYLHDGRALALEEIWTAPDVGDLHGVVTDLTKTDLNDLVEFLKGL
jgi:YVTN family beta-propeller protein